MAAIWIIDEILEEVRRAKRKHPYWQDHIVGAAGVVTQKSGALMRAAMKFKYEAPYPADKQLWKEEMRKQAIQTAAAAIRFLDNL